MSKAIKIVDLSKVFYNNKEEIWALDHVSLDVKKGEIFGLLGPNGAGKTTTIRLIGGLLKPSSGSIFINDNKIDDNTPEFRAKLGFLTENPGLYENLTVLENLRFYGSFYDIDLETRVNSILRNFDLNKRKDMMVGKLSKGQKQRLAIARAILHDPEIVFFDEPTSSLDPKAAVNVRNIILNLKSTNRTIFINSHNLEEIQKLCDRIAILDKGKIRKIGTPEELRKELWHSQEIIFILREVVSSEIKKKISTIDSIKSSHIENNIISIHADNLDELTPYLIEEFIKYGAKILEVKRNIQSLEDIYLKLMEED